MYIKWKLRRSPSLRSHFEYFVWGDAVCARKWRATARNHIETDDVWHGLELDASENIENGLLINTSGYDLIIEAYCCDARTNASFCIRLYSDCVRVVDASQTAMKIHRKTVLSRAPTETDTHTHTHTRCCWQWPFDSNLPDFITVCWAIGGRYFDEGERVDKVCWLLFTGNVLKSVIFAAYFSAFPRRMLWVMPFMESARSSSIVGHP